jgi:hypothetical protein
MKSLQSLLSSITCQLFPPFSMSSGSVVGIVTGYGLDDRGLGSPSLSRVKNCLFSVLSRSALGLTEPPIQCVPGALSPRLKWLGHEADRSPPPSAEI